MRSCGGPQELDVDGLLELLRGAHSAVVLSKVEDARVTAAGYGYASPDSADVWARYRAAGLDLASFGPLLTPEATATADSSPNHFQ